MSLLKMMGVVIRRGKGERGGKEEVNGFFVLFLGGFFWVIGDPSFC